MSSSPDSWADIVMVVAISLVKGSEDEDGGHVCASSHPLFTILRKTQVKETFTLIQSTVQYSFSSLVN